MRPNYFIIVKIRTAVSLDKYLKKQELNPGAVVVAQVVAQQRTTDLEVQVSIPTGSWAFFLFFTFLSLSNSGVSLNRSLMEVQHY